MSKPFDIICIGSTSQDIFFPTDEGVIIETPEDLTSKVKIAFELGGKYRVADRYEALGGVAANVAQGLVKQGLSTACYSKVGADNLGHSIKEALKKAGVADCLFTDESVRTDLSAIIVLTQNGERTIFHNRDANEKLEILEEKLLPAKWFFVSALNGDWKTNMQKILEIKTKGNVRLAFNPGQHNIKEDGAEVRQAIAQADILVLNKDEALELLSAGEKEDGQRIDQDERILLEKLHSLKQSSLIIGLTDGRRGAWASDGSRLWHCPSPAIAKPVDATGAGDAFASAFFGALCQNLPLENALKRGVTNSRSVLGFYGASEGLLSGESLEGKARELEATELT